MARKVKIAMKRAESAIIAGALAEVVYPCRRPKNPFAARRFAKLVIR